MSDNTSDYVIIGLAVLFLVFAIVYAIKKSNEKKKTKKEIEDKYGSSKHAILKHINGLPLSQNVNVDVFYCSDAIVFKKDKQEIIVSKSKITDIDEVTGEDIKQEIAMGATAGKYLKGGKTGAILGAVMSTTLYLVIAYTSNGEDKFITLDIAQSGGFAGRIVRDFKKNNTSEGRTIEL